MVFEKPSRCCGPWRWTERPERINHAPHGEPGNTETNTVRFLGKARSLNTFAQTKVLAEIQTPVDVSIGGQINYSGTIVVLKIFEASMPGDIKGTLTAEEVKRSAVQSTLILIFEEKECSFIVRPEFKVFSSKGAQKSTLTNVIKGVLCEILHANLALTEKTKPAGVTPSVLVAEENRSSDPRRDFLEQGAVLHPSLI